MEKKRKTKIRKWDEVGGVVETEIVESAGSFDETPGAGPSVSRNPMRGIEDMVEQNDNSFDGMIYVRVTKDEWKQIHERMAEVGMKNMSAFIRKMALNGYLIKLVMSDVKEVLRLLHINSNNLNQYAKRANETGSIYEADIKDLQKSQQEILKLMGEILDRLSSI